MGLGLFEYWGMPLREYVHRVKGYMSAENKRRAELQRALYPIYACVHAQLGGKQIRMTPEQFMPTGIKQETGPTRDPNKLINKSLERINRMNRKA